MKLVTYSLPISDMKHSVHFTYNHVTIITNVTVSNKNIYKWLIYKKKSGKQQPRHVKCKAGREVVSGNEEQKIDSKFAYMYINQQDAQNSCH